MLLPTCTPTPQPIEFGTDPCAHCKMTIVDKPFASELVTKKGRVFKFDAIECMIQYIQENKDLESGLLLVNDYNQPGEWLNAEDATFMISKEIPSPMGGYLSAYSTNEEAQSIQSQKGGELLTWDGLLQNFSH